MARGAAPAWRDVVPADRRYRPARRPRRVRRPRPGVDPGRPADGAAAARVQPRGSVPRRTRKGAPTTRRSCARRRTSDDATSSRCSTACGSITIAPEIPGALELIALAARAGRRGLAGPLGGDPRPGARRLRRRWDHDDPPVQRDERRGASRARAWRSRRSLDDDAYVELIADGHHVDPALWRAHHPDRSRPIG